VARQLLNYLNKSRLLPRLQSSYRVGHLTETAESKVLSDILLSIDTVDLSALVLLDLSAFHTVDHHILIRRLKKSYGRIWNGAGVVPDVPRRPVSVRPNRFLSISCNSHHVWCTAGVCSRPYLVPVVYTADMILCPHLKVDENDTQIYGSCRPSASLELQNTIIDCVDHVAR